MLRTPVAWRGTRLKRLDHLLLFPYAGQARMAASHSTPRPGERSPARRLCGDCSGPLQSSHSSQPAAGMAWARPDMHTLRQAARSLASHFDDRSPPSLPAQRGRAPALVERIALPGPPSLRLAWPARLAYLVARGRTLLLLLSASPCCCSTAIAAHSGVVYMLPVHAPDRFPAASTA